MTEKELNDMQFVAEELSSNMAVQNRNRVILALIAEIRNLKQKESNNYNEVNPNDEFGH